MTKAASRPPHLEYQRCGIRLVAVRISWVRNSSGTGREDRHAPGFARDCSAACHSARRPGTGRHGDGWPNRRMRNGGRRRRCCRKARSLPAFPVIRQEGPFVIRLKMPKGYRIPAHTHPTAEYVTVLSGHFHAGMGDKLDQKKGTAFAPAGFVAMPANMRHYAWTSSETVIQIQSAGPVRDDLRERGGRSDKALRRSAGSDAREHHADGGDHLVAPAAKICHRGPKRGPPDGRRKMRRHDDILAGDLEGWMQPPRAAAEGRGTDHGPPALRGDCRTARTPAP